MHYRWLLFWIVLLTGGCATTQLSHERLASKPPAEAFQRLLILGPPGFPQRQAFEAALASSLRQLSGTDTVVSEADEPSSAEAITQLARSQGADGVLTVLPVDMRIIHHPSPLGRYPYHGFYAYTPVPVMQFQVLRLRLSVYALEGKEPLWQGISESIDPGADLPIRLATTVAARLNYHSLVLPIAEHSAAETMD